MERQLDRFGYCSRSLLAELERLREKHPRHERVARDLRRALRAVDDVQGLIKFHREALAQGKRSASRRRRLAALLNRAGRPAAAERILRPLVEQRPGDPDIARLLGMSLFSQGRYAEAAPHFDRHWKVLERRNAAMLYTVRGTICYRRGNHERAIELLHKALAEKPDSYKAHFILARTLAEAGRPKQARKRMSESQRLKRRRRALERWKRSVTNLALLTRKNKIEQAKTVVKRLLEEADSDLCRGLLWTLRGHLRGARGERGAAEAAFSRSRALRAGAGAPRTERTRFLAQRLANVRIGKGPK